MSSKLIFVVGDNCMLSDEVSPSVDVFLNRYPDVELIKLKAGQDEQEFTKLTNQHMQSTPAFVAIVDDKVVSRHEGRACDNKIAQMFGLEAPRGQ